MGTHLPKTHGVFTPVQLVAICLLGTGKSKFAEIDTKGASEGMFDAP